jgi:hypothetical protein
MSTLPAKRTKVYVYESYFMFFFLPLPMASMTPYIHLLSIPSGEQNHPHPSIFSGSVARAGAPPMSTPLPPSLLHVCCLHSLSIVLLHFLYVIS